MISMKSIESISCRRRRRRRQHTRNNRVLFEYKILFILIVLLYSLYSSYFVDIVVVVYAFPTGAGSCIGSSSSNGGIVSSSAIGGPHLTATTVTELQSWEDRSIQVFIGGYTYIPNYNTTIPLLTNIEYTIFILQNPNGNVNDSFKGFLVRLENLDNSNNGNNNNNNNNDTYELSSELVLLRRDMEQQRRAETCPLPNIIGITHTNAQPKTKVGIGIRSNRTMTVALDITLVFEANVNSSIYAHGRYSLSFFAKPSTEQSISPTTLPPVPTPSATVPTSSTSPTLVPIVVPSTNNNNYNNPISYNVPSIPPNTDGLIPLLMSPSILPPTHIFYPITLSPKSRRTPTDTDPVNSPTNLKRDQNHENEMNLSVDNQLPVQVQVLRSMMRNSHNTGTTKSLHSFKSKDNHRKKKSKTKAKAIRISSKTIRSKSTIDDVSSNYKSMKGKKKGHGEKGKKKKMDKSKKMHNR